MSDGLLSVLHISDFHFTRRKAREQGIVIDALIDDLKAFCIGHRRPDVVLFTGDMVNAGGVDLHTNAYDFFLDRVSKATGCADERIFVTPGNHDASRSVVAKFLRNHRDWQRESLASGALEWANRLYLDEDANKIFREKFQDFDELVSLMGFSKSLNSSTDKIYYKIVKIDHLKLEVIVLNTALLSCGGYPGMRHDEGLLSFPEYALIEIEKALEPGSFRIVSTHHPLSALNAPSAKLLEGFISKNAHLHVFGHMHDPQPRVNAGLRGEYKASQAGAIFTARRGAYIGYSLLIIEPEKGLQETHLRSYFPERGEFSYAEDIIGGGIWSSSPAANEFFRGIASPIEDSVFREHLATRALSNLEDRELPSEQLGEEHFRFVAPPMKRTFLTEKPDTEGELEQEVDLTFEELLNDTNNLIIYSRPEYGRSTLLREIRYRYLHDAKDIRSPRLPVFIDFSEIKYNHKNLVRKLRGASELPPDGSDIMALLQLGLACVIIDDVDFNDTIRMAILRKFVTSYPKSRYIFSSPTSSAVRFSASVDPEMPVRFEFVELREFKRKHMRQMLENDRRCSDVDGWVDRIQEEFHHISLPFTAANGSLIIEILSERYNFSPINRAVLMEQFVDLTLRKASVEQSRRETFDYTNKTDLLASIAAWMAKNDAYVVGREELRERVKAYIDEKGLNVDIDSVLGEFYECKIFIGRSDDRVSFKYRGFLEYFIALKMSSDAQFRAWVLDESRYLTFGNEIQYYAGRNRGDGELLALVAERHEAIFDAAFEEIGRPDFSILDALKLPEEGAEEEFEELVDSIFDEPLSKSERDEELEAQIPEDHDNRQEVFRPELSEGSDKLLLSLFLYSGLVKNLELLPDASKRAHLRKLWEGWSTMLLASIKFAPKLAKDRRVRVNGALYEVHAPQGLNRSKLLRHMMVKLPHVQLRWIASHLGTEKLERQLLEPQIEDANEPTIFAFFRTGLISALRLNGTTSSVDDLVKRLRGKKYLSWSFIEHMAELRRMGRIKPEHFARIEGPVAGVIADARGGSKSDQAKERSRQRQRFLRERLLIEARSKRDE